MATVHPSRPQANSSGAPAQTPSSGGPHRRPSLASFPSSTKQRSRSSSQSTHDHTKGPHHYPHSQPGSADHSNHSSLPSIQQRARPSNPNSSQRVQKPIKSQYPPDSEEKHVEYILVASFDIDRGSIMEHQYPGPVGGDEQMLAELMLPDQAHVRSQDWTVFFLHKDAGGEDDEGSRKKGRRRQNYGDGEQAGTGAQEGSDDDEDDYYYESSDEGDDIDGPPLVYVLNLVNTKHDATIKRGAIVKAMAICTRHSFLHIYKPLLLLALEQYFANPVVETLASLYEAVNGMDLSLMPKLSFYERLILQSSDVKDLFLEKFEAIIAQRMQAKAKSNGDSGGLSSPPSPTSALPNRGRYGLPRDTHEFESVVRYSNVPVPVKIPVALSAETVGDFSLIKLISTFSSPHTTSPVPFNPTHPHLTTSGPLTHPVIVLINALLTQKRIIFLGYNLPSSEVAEAVLGACSLASGGLLRGFTRHAFPYTDLTKIDDLLKVPGFIAGVTNPAFGHKTEWWDLLCDLSTGRVRISNRIETPPPSEGVAFFQQGGQGTLGPGGSMAAIAAAGNTLAGNLGGSSSHQSSANDLTGDSAFMVSVLAAITDRHGENAIRSKFRRWVLKFTRLAASFEETVYGASALHIHAPTTSTTTSPKTPLDSPISPTTQKDDPMSMSPEASGHGYVWPTPQAKNVELAANAMRIEGWRNTRSYYNFIQDLATHYVHRPVKDLDVQYLHDMLAKLRLGAADSGNIYMALCSSLNTDSEISQMLAVISTTGGGLKGGLFCVAAGVLHPRIEVRETVAELILRIREHEAGRHFWAGVGGFVRVAWERVLQVREARIAANATE